MIKSRLNANAFILLTLNLFFLVLSLYLIAHPGIQLKINTLLAGVLMLVPTLFLSYILAKNLHFITIEADRIIIKGALKTLQIPRSEISSVNLLSMEDFYWSAGSTTIGTRIELPDGSIFVIRDPFYSNIHLIKQTIAKNFPEKIRTTYKPKSINDTLPVLETACTKIAGNFFTSLNGLLFIGLTATTILLLLFTNDFKSGYLFLFIPVVIFYFGLGAQLNYFLLSNKRIIIKNHLLFWVNKVYYINDIIAVNFESPYRRSDALRITTNDFKSRCYPAGSLRKKHWDELREKSESLSLHFIR